MLLSRALLKRHSVLPGFDLALGFTLLYLSFIVLVPLSAAFLKTFTMTWPAFWDAVTAPQNAGHVIVNVFRNAAESGTRTMNER